MKSLLLAASLVLVAGCGDDDPGRCMVLTATGVEPERTATFGYAAPEFTPYEAGGAYPIIMGMQGGYMVVPIIRVPADAVDPSAHRPEDVLAVHQALERLAK